MFQVEQINIRKKAQKATQRCAGRQNLYGCFKPSIYRVDDNMFVRMRSGHHRVSQKHFVIRGVLKRSLELQKYKTEFQMPNSPTPTQKWISVSDMTNVTRQEEKQRPKSKRVVNMDLRMPYSHEDRLEDLESINLNIRFDPIRDGCCQFAAISDQLATIGIFCSAETLSGEVVADLTFHPNGMDGTPLSE